MPELESQTQYRLMIVTDTLFKLIVINNFKGMLKGDTESGMSLDFIEKSIFNSC